MEISATKLKLPINYNTLANFDFENQLKLDYTGKDDEIIKRLKQVTFHFHSKGILIPGAQSLFGVKTQLQFGKLFVTGVLANQRSQRQSLGLQGGAANTYLNSKRMIMKRTGTFCWRNISGIIIIRR